MKITIRQTQESDYAAILKLLQDTKLCGTEFTEERFRNMLARNREFCYAAEAKGQIVGNVFGTHDGGFIASIRKVAVANQYRRKKIASDLVRKVVEKFDGIKIPLVYAHVEKTNNASLKMLDSLGFSIRKTHYLIDKGEPKQHNK